MIIMNAAELARIKAIAARNRDAMQREADARRAERERLAAARRDADAHFHADMVRLATLVATCPGAPLTAAQHARLADIKRRHQALADLVDALERAEQKEDV
jgi:hypothetical protein